MEFTFGIITDGTNDIFINEMIESIQKNNIPNYEIIIVGNTQINISDKIKIFYFDENIKPQWITKKKNIVAENALYENIVLLHDYIKLNSDWYEGFLIFGNNFDWCVNKIINKNGTRFRDYTLFPNKIYTNYLKIDYSPVDIVSYFNNNCLLPYDFKNNIKINKYMYISGSYYIIKKAIALKYPLNEDLSAGMAEDLLLTQQLHNNNIIIKCNRFSSVTFLKYKEPVFFEHEMSYSKLQNLIDYCYNH